MASFSFTESSNSSWNSNNTENFLTSSNPSTRAKIDLYSSSVKGMFLFNITIDTNEKSQTRLRAERGEALASGTEFKGLPKNSVIKKNNILCDTLKKKIKMCAESDGARIKVRRVSLSRSRTFRVRPWSSCKTSLSSSWIFSAFWCWCLEYFDF